MGNKTRWGIALIIHKYVPMMAKRKLVRHLMKANTLKTLGVGRNCLEVCNKKVCEKYLILKHCES